MALCLNNNLRQDAIDSVKVFFPAVVFISLGFYAHQICIVIASKPSKRIMLMDLDNLSAMDYRTMCNRLCFDCNPNTKLWIRSRLLRFASLTFQQKESSLLLELQHSDGKSLSHRLFGSITFAPEYYAKSVESELFLKFMNAIWLNIRPMEHKSAWQIHKGLSILCANEKCVSRTHLWRKRTENCQTRIPLSLQTCIHLIKSIHKCARALVHAIQQQSDQRNERKIGSQVD